MPGRKKTPSALSIIKGNPGKRPLPKNEPKPKVVAPHAPGILSDEAKKHWRVVVKHLAAAKLMTRLDTDALAMYCEAYAKWVSANESIKEEGMIVITDSGYPVQHPYVGISNKAFDQMKSILIEFGMTPSSRTNVSVVDEGKGGDGWGDI